jgi:gamma-glutamylcyclotransferase (GGCT)/AIG2-like uncharacterized protein YtfP
MTQLYFSYGANLNVKGMRDRCPLAVAIRRFSLPNWQLAFSQVATIVPDTGKYVPGVIWGITDACEDSLDQFEGYPYLYNKQYVETTVGRLMFYVMNTDPPIPPGSTYLNTIMQGYRDWQLDTSYLHNAVAQSQLPG